jgi:hypothetical protein
MGHSLRRPLETSPGVVVPRQGEAEAHPLNRAACAWRSRRTSQGVWLMTSNGKPHPGRELLERYRVIKAARIARQAKEAETVQGCAIG